VQIARVIFKHALEMERRKKMGVLTKQERKAKIGDIVEKVTQMSDEQLGNVHEYTSDEFNEPNHEAVALNAVIQLSRKYGKSEDGK
jgi:hypothetical protein